MAGALAPHELAVGVARHMRAAGGATGPDSAIAAVAALDAFEPPSPADVYWALRLTLVRRAEDLAIFHAVFDRLAGDDHGVPSPAGATTAGHPREPGENDAGTATPTVVTPSSEVDGDGDQTTGAAASAVDLLRRKDFELYGPDDFRDLARELARLPVPATLRASRRRRRRAAGEIDLRATVRASLRTGGVPLRLRRHGPRPVPRPLVFVCDVSGSMQAHARAVVLLAHVVAAGRRRVEAFAFATRLTRLTPLLHERDPVATVAGIRDLVQDWSGGTRIGETLGVLRREHGHRLRGAVVVLATDGWERGDPELLGREAAWLARTADVVVWVSPHLRDPDYEPLTRGLVAALPHVDHFVAGHDLASVEGLLELLRALSLGT